MPRVAIVTCRSPEGTLGGAERLYEGLIEAFANAGWDAEEVPIVFDESNIDGIYAGYAAARRLNVLMYDLVVSTKAPTYCVLHPNHAVWLIHTIRVFYDKYEETLAKEAWAPKARETIQRLDTAALGRRTLRRFSIGDTVGERLERYNGLDAITLHPPHPHAERFTDRSRAPASAKGDGRYLFTASRLHRWKRIDLIIRAKMLMKERIRLVIAGDGAEAGSLRALAYGHDDIEFVGNIGEDRLHELYAGATAIPFVPEDEDYGYVTIEAFLKGVPVVTVSDSGEPAKIVAQSCGGIVCESTAQGLAKALDRICSSPEAARDMGEAGRRWANGLSWAKVVEALSNA